MENYLLLCVFIGFILTVFGLGDLTAYIHEKYFCSHSKHLYWSAYQRN